MSKFKVGDKVRTSDDYRGYLLSCNKTYTVADVRHRGAEVLVKIDGEYTDGTRPQNGLEEDVFQLVETVKPTQRALKGDNKAVFSRLVDGRVYSVEDIKAHVQAHTGRQPTDATITARIRDLRKPIYGGFNIQRHQQGRKHFYQLVTS